MKRLLLATLAAAGALSSLPAAAQFAKPEDAVKYRKAVMTVMANHFGRVGAMVNGRAPYDAAAAAANVEIAASMSRLPFIAFVDGTTGSSKGEASAKIWSDRAKFDAGAKSLQDEMAKLVAASKANNLDALKAAFGPVGQSCKACHDDFRNP